MNKVVLTFDLDWCTDEVLDYLLDKLIKNNIPATFFVTHDTKLLNKIKKYNFFELGIHPNFNDGSTHGNSYKEVIDHCLSIVPKATSCRPHGLKVSSNKLIYMMEKGIKIDCSIFMPNVSNLENFYFEINNHRILRVPYNWEDDYEFYQRDKKYQFSDIQNLENKILDFHPIHVYLNSDSEKQYKMYKANKEFSKNMGIGTETMLDEIIKEYLKGSIQIMNLKEYVGSI
ncbi:hypothetical protein CRV01_05470 [Arcobacter sp. CECT 8983]|uniref:polysaccharide deacetylase WbmS family protein n=1 Tax=Arcobacter sp. CECT 8983 TaxID=2044508 RepID=UPI00100ACB52|nr:hypothetical protein [Arcobacter sp. CECT 8983]RXJ90603.1 hypothetical protein CRV01_05470 [Arcobacter sp. CECT 8983]